MECIEIGLRDDIVEPFGQLVLQRILLNLPASVFEPFRQQDAALSGALSPYLDVAALNVVVNQLPSGRPGWFRVMDIRIESLRLESRHVDPVRDPFVFYHANPVAPVQEGNLWQFFPRNPDALGNTAQDLISPLPRLPSIHIILNIRLQQAVGVEELVPEVVNGVETGHFVPVLRHAVPSGQIVSLPIALDVVFDVGHRAVNQAATTLVTEAVLALRLKQVSYFLRGEWADIRHTASGDMNNGFVFIQPLYTELLTSLRDTLAAASGAVNSNSDILIDYRNMNRASASPLTVVEEDVQFMIRPTDLFRQIGVYDYAIVNIATVWLPGQLLLRLELANIPLWFDFEATRGLSLSAWVQEQLIMGTKSEARWRAFFASPVPVQIDDNFGVALRINARQTIAPIFQRTAVQFASENGVNLAFRQPPVIGFWNSLEDPNTDVVSVNAAVTLDVGCTNDIDVDVSSRIFFSVSPEHDELYISGTLDVDPNDLDVLWCAVQASLALTLGTGAQLALYPAQALFTVFAGLVGGTGAGDAAFHGSGALARWIGETTSSITNAVSQIADHGEGTVVIESGALAGSTLSWHTIETFTWRFSWHVTELLGLIDVGLARQRDKMRELTLPLDNSDLLSRWSIGSEGSDNLSIQLSLPSVVDVAEAGVRLLPPTARIEVLRARGGVAPVEVAAPDCRFETATFGWRFWVYSIPAAPPLRIYSVAFGPPSLDRAVSWSSLPSVDAGGEVVVEGPYFWAFFQLNFDLLALARIGKDLSAPLRYNFQIALTTNAGVLTVDAGPIFAGLGLALDAALPGPLSQKRRDRWALACQSQNSLVDPLGTQRAVSDILRRLFM